MARTETSNELRAVILVDPALEQTAAQLDGLTQQCATAILSAAGHMQRALITARGIQALRGALTAKVMAEIMPLMNSPLGFVTDRGPGKKNETPYPVEVVRDCAIEAMLNGVYLTGNQWNILVGRCYITQNGWKMKFETVPGISDIRLSPGVPGVHNGGPVCRIALSWKLNGKADCLIGPDGKAGQPFPLIAQGGASADQLIGKAKRKAYKLAFEQATGSVCTVPDGELGDPAERIGLPAASKTEEVLAKLNAGGNGDGAKPATPEQLERIGIMAEGLATQEAIEQHCREIDADPFRLNEFQANEILRWLEKMEPAGYAP